MVISRVGKRKRNVPSATAARPTQELPKRPKVQAQRKFAQVTGGSIHSTLPASLLHNGNTRSDGRSNDTDPNNEDIQRPDTGHFLSYLSYRSTSYLPTQLHYFRPSKDGLEVVRHEGNKTAKNNLASNTVETIKIEKIEPKQDDVKPNCSANADEGEKSTASTQKCIMPFAVRKRADLVTAGSRKPPGQGTKKNQTEQQKAKTRDHCKTRASATDDGESSKQVKIQKSKQKDSANKNDSTNSNDNGNRTKRKLRNADDSQSDKEVIPAKSTKMSKEISARTTTKAELTKKVGTRNTKSLGPSATKPTDKPPEEANHSQTTVRTTRQRSYSLPKSDSKSYVKGANANEQNGNEDNEVKPNQKNDKIEAAASTAGEHNDEDSDDDEPLADKKQNKNAGGEKVSKKGGTRAFNRRGRLVDESGPAVDQKSETSTKLSKSQTLRRKESLSGAEKTAANSKRSLPSRNSVPIKSNESEDTDGASQDNCNRTKKRTGLKRQPRVELTDHSQTDQSENETRAGRPMRKTKQAATFFMELIGQKLNLSDFNDDHSMDSFPELPNVRKTEQMENELKANLKREKMQGPAPKRGKTNTTDGKVTPKPSKAKRVKQTKNANDSRSNKSFDDSDDEPLATKVERKTTTPTTSRKKVATPPVKVEDDKCKAPVGKKATKNTDKLVIDSVVMAEPKARGKNTTKIITSTPQRNIELTPKTQNTPSPAKSFDLLETEFKMPAESVKQLLSPPINVSPLKIPSPHCNRDKSDKDIVQSSPSSHTSPQSISAILADLMPSKEESGKIFGIASVTLAQSSGPIDTKCTLGKCGSIHKTSLGPGVVTTTIPTEAYLGDQMSTRDRRKAKVNMTHEQIEKWLTDCAGTADPFESDSIDDDLDLLTPPKPINYMNVAEARNKSKAPKARNRLAPPISANLLAIKIPSPTPRAKAIKQSQAESSKKVFDKLPEKVAAKSIVKEEISPIKLPTTTPNSKGNQLNTSLSSPSKFNVSNATSATPEKKPIYKRTPVYNTKKDDSLAKKSTPVVNTFGAFSPENEVSVYSFDKEEDNLPTSLPFRRHSKRGSIFSKDQADDVVNKKGPTEGPKQTSYTSVRADISQVTPPIEKSDLSKSTVALTKAIANDKSVALDIKDEKVDSDDDGHTFYIPLQCIANTGGAASGSEMIQGVAVKLGTEGPDGPNQKVIMHAKLVTKSQLSANATPMPEGFGMANIHEIVKNLIANKDATGSKSFSIDAEQSSAIKTLNVAAQSSIPLAVPIVPLNVPVPVPVPASTPPTAPLLPPPPPPPPLREQSPAQSPKVKAQRRSKLDAVAIRPMNDTVFPRYDDPAQMVEAPVFCPTEKEFQDPIEFINRITPIAARFGLCRIIPPASFKPECKISDDMRFTAYNQYVHKMLHRWGPSCKEFNAIKNYLTTQSITLKQPPLIGGMEVDLPRLYHTVQELGGLKEVIEKKKWARVAEEMCIPKSAQDRVAKLDDIYCKYLLPYDTLSPNERQKLFDEVEAEWAKKEAKARRNADRSTNSNSESADQSDKANANENDDEDDDDDNDDEDDEDRDSDSMECIVKGKSMALSAFFRVARNTMALWFRNSDPPANEVEAEFWRHVAVRDSHVCVHSGSIDSSGWGYGFPSPGPKTKNSTCSKHPWNLKVLTNNHNSILRSIGPIAGVTVPTLHVGMLFSACCWYRDPHGLPWIEYLHTGGSKIWYSVPNEQSSSFRSAFTSLLPTHCQSKTIWLPCDTAMVPPHMLTDRGVSLCRTEQEPGQFIIVFPRAYTSNICTGYAISESVYFAPMSWLKSAKEDFKDIHDSCEPAMFSLEQLLFSVASDVRTNAETLENMLPMLKEVHERENKEREEIKALGVNRTEKMTVKQKKPQTDNANECDICRANLYISWIACDDDIIYCLQHAIKYLKNNRIQAKQCKILVKYGKNEIEGLIEKVTERITEQQKKKK